MLTGLDLLLRGTHIPFLSPWMARTYVLHIRSGREGEYCGLLFPIMSVPSSSKYVVFPGCHDDAVHIGIATVLNLFYYHISRSQKPAVHTRIKKKKKKKKRLYIR